MVPGMTRLIPLCLSARNFSFWHIYLFCVTAFVWVKVKLYHVFFYHVYLHVGPSFDPVSDCDPDCDYCDSDCGRWW